MRRSRAITKKNMPFCAYFNLAVTLPAALLVVSGFLVCEGACKLVVSGGVTRGRVARGAMWRRHRGAWRPKAQAQKQPKAGPGMGTATGRGALSISED